MSQSQALSPGSSWLRWDPHVHLPGTALNDQFGDLGVAAALDHLASRDPAISVVGVTDYFSTQIFREARDAHAAGAGASIDLLFPNVELRLDIPTGKGAALNLHLLCAPEHVDSLDRFLGGLEFSWRERTYRADTNGLVALGRALREDSNMEEAAARRIGSQQFKVTFETLRKSFRSDAWAREYCLVGVAGGSSDGTSGLQSQDGGFRARRQSIESFAHFVFSGNPNQQEFWRGDGVLSVTELTKEYGSPKPCLHGSDAHSAEALGVPDEDRYTWIKGVATFDALRMACLTPRTRCHVGTEPPLSARSGGRITGVALDGGDWFSNRHVPLNTGLVAIIGPRGSGKTALADLIAAGGGSIEPFLNGSSFISRARGLLREATVKLAWADGEPTTLNLSNSDPNQDPRQVRYLSQQFVERLCAADGVTDDLLQEVERVVYEAWPIEQRQGASTFSELLAIHSEAAKNKQASEAATVQKLSGEILDLRVLQQSLPSLKSEAKTLMNAITGAEKEQAALVAQNAVGDLERLAAVNRALEERQGQLQVLDRRRTALSTLNEAIRVARSSTFPGLLDGFKRQHALAALPPEDWGNFVVDFVGDVDDVVARHRAEAEESYRLIAGESDTAKVLSGVQVSELEAQSVSSLRLERERLEGLVGLDQQRTAALSKLNERLVGLRSRLSRLNAEIARADQAETEILHLSARRSEAYAAFFDALLDESEQLNRLYAPLSRIMASGRGSMAKLAFSVKRMVDMESWAAEGEGLLDLRTAGPFRGTGELRRRADEALGNAWQTGNGAVAAEALAEFSRNHSEAIRRHASVDKKDAKAYREWEQAVSSWMYGADHVTLEYDLTYDGVSVERLSPGSRGIVLLLLYLAVDQEESTPLIIDQPEENLDPESVYSELVTLFQAAAQRRQIVMVTHNANLVVNTDVDQVIIASSHTAEANRLPAISYMSGGLEEVSIRRGVCDILEGGEEAFRERARRLGLDLLGSMAT